jgi:hypothetical protein
MCRFRSEAESLKTQNGSIVSGGTQQNGNLWGMTDCELFMSVIMQNEFQKEDK